MQVESEGDCPWPLPNGGNIHSPTFIIIKITGRNTLARKLKQLFVNKKSVQYMHPTAVGDRGSHNLVLKAKRHALSGVSLPTDLS